MLGYLHDNIITYAPMTCPLSQRNAEALQTLGLDPPVPVSLATTRNFNRSKFVPAQFKGPKWQSKFGDAGTATSLGKDGAQVSSERTIDFNDPFWNSASEDERELNKIGSRELVPEPAADFQPSQSQINAFISLGAASEMLLPGIHQKFMLTMGGNLNGIVTGKDARVHNRRWILDGHHRWLAVFLLDPCLTLTGQLLEAPLEVLHPVLTAIGDKIGNPRNYAGSDAANIFKLAHNPRRMEIIAGFVRIYNMGRLSASDVSEVGPKISPAEAVRLSIADNEAMAPAFLEENTEFRKQGDGDRLLTKVGIISIYKHALSAACQNEQFVCEMFSSLLAPDDSEAAEKGLAGEALHAHRLRMIAEECVRLLDNMSETDARNLHIVASKSIDGVGGTMRVSDQAVRESLRRYLTQTSTTDTLLKRIGLATLANHVALLESYRPQEKVQPILENVYGETATTPPREGMPVIEAERDLRGEKKCLKEVKSGDDPQRQCQLQYVANVLKEGRLAVYDS